VQTGTEKVGPALRGYRRALLFGGTGGLAVTVFPTAHEAQADAEQRRKVLQRVAKLGANGAGMLGREIDLPGGRETVGPHGFHSVTLCLSALKAAFFMELFLGESG
jgi:hypothetical protein